VSATGARVPGWVSGVAFLALLASAPPAVPAVAQQASKLDQVEDLARLGRTDDARDVLREWWEASYEEASRKDVQQALWLRGRLTVDPEQGGLDFRRLVVEFPGGSYSDQALARLAQAAFAAGDSVQAVRDVDRLATEYPASAARREAEAWLAGAGSPPPVYRRPDRPERDQGPRDRLVDTRRYAVQLGAFSDRDRAVALRDRAAAAGLQARLATVPGSPLVRVRVGRFDAADGASDILRRVRDAGFTATLVKDAHLEGRSGA
jgi:cell division septation protein DedD